MSSKRSGCCCCGSCGGGCCNGGGGSWSVHDLCHHGCGDHGWCGAGCMCGNCCGGFGCPVTNHGCNGGCCPSVTFPCSFGACVNNPCCECCREPAPPGKCKWPCLWPCCCECTPPKFKFKPLKPKPVCHCPHDHCCSGHKRSGPLKRQFVGAVSPPEPVVMPTLPLYGHPLYGQTSLYGHPGLAAPLALPPYGYGHPLGNF